MAFWFRVIRRHGTDRQVDGRVECFVQPLWSMESHIITKWVLNNYTLKLPVLFGNFHTDWRFKSRLKSSWSTSQKEMSIYKRNRNVSNNRWLLTCSGELAECSWRSDYLDCTAVDTNKQQKTHTQLHNTFNTSKLKMSGRSISSTRFKRCDYSSYFYLYLLMLTDFDNISQTAPIVNFQ